MFDAILATKFNSKIRGLGICELANLRINGLLDFWIVGFVDCRSNGILD
jgi:hypothetical protein